MADQKFTKPITPGSLASGKEGERPTAMTDLERDVLTGLGIDPNQELPANMADLLRQHARGEDVSKAANPALARVLKMQAAARAEAENPPPPDVAGREAAPPQFTPVEEMSEANRTKFQGIIEDALRQEQLQKAAAKGPNPLLNPETQKALEQMQRDAAEELRDWEGTASSPESKDDSTSAAELQFCPNCDWELRRPVDVEITDGDKRIFLAALLGGQQFFKPMTAYNDQVSMTFRTLTGLELDACYKCAAAELADLQVDPTVAYAETLSRYRLALSLVTLKMGPRTLELPRGLSRLTNPLAENFWLEEPGLNVADLPAVLNTVFKTYLSSETLLRLGNHLMVKFSSLVVRLEAHSEQENFWKGIEL